MKKSTFLLQGRALSWVYSQEQLKLSTKAILIVLADNIGDSFQCEITMRQLARTSGYDKRTAMRATQELQELGLIDVQKRPGLPNIFTLKIPEEYE